MMKRLSLIPLLAFGALTSAACSAPTSDGEVKPHLAVVDQRLGSAPEIASVSGQYEGCSQHSDGDPWHIKVSGSGAPTDLQVVKDDASCRLKVTAINAGADELATPTITLATSFASQASAFAPDGGSIAFYANAKIDSLAYDSDFTISVLVSSTPNAQDGGTGSSATYAVQSGTVSSSAVAAPDYSVNPSGVALSMNVDHVVQTATGGAQLSDGQQAGQDWAVVDGTLGDSPSLEDIASAWSGAADGRHGAIADLTSEQIPAAAFNLEGQDLDSSPQRTIILRNQENGVPSYELLLVTFGLPSN